MNNYKFFFLLLLSLTTSFIKSDPQIKVNFKDNLFIKVRVPDRGIVCSNVERVNRLKDLLKNATLHKTSWGTNVYIGTYKNRPMFIVNAPVGSGSGLVFTELYAAGAVYIVRFGSDDVKSPQHYEFDIVKLVNESDNLVGYSHASGVAPEKWAEAIPASKKLLNAFKANVKFHNLRSEERICHHLENYHALRNPKIYSPERQARIQKILSKLKRGKDIKESFDMETAVLYQVAQDYERHAITLLQTVDKESLIGPYAGQNLEKALVNERKISTYALDTLAQL